MQMCQLSLAYTQITTKNVGKFIMLIYATALTPSKDMPKGIQWFKHFPINFITPYRKNGNTGLKKKTMQKQQKISYNSCVTTLKK